MHADDPSEWLEVGHPPVHWSGSWRKPKIKPLHYFFFKLEQNWSTWIRVVPTSVTRGIHLQQHFREVCLMYHFDSEQNVSGTHERGILPHLQPVIFRDGFMTELKHRCATITRSKIFKKVPFLITVFRSCSHGFLIPGKEWRSKLGINLLIKLPCRETAWQDFSECDLWSRSSKRSQIRSPFLLLLLFFIILPNISIGSWNHFGRGMLDGYRVHAADSHDLVLLDDAFWNMPDVPRPLVWTNPTVLL